MKFPPHRIRLLLAALLLAGFNPFFPPLYVLSPRSLGMGGAVSAETDKAEAFWVNPAAAAFVRPEMTQSHSTRHFPGKKRNLDQLDDDAVALVYPVGGYVGALAFSVEGEFGYDYSERNDEAFPPENYRGREVMRGGAWRLAFAGIGWSEREFRYVSQEAGRTTSYSGTSSAKGRVWRWFPWLATAWAREQENAEGLEWKHLTRTRTGNSLKVFPWLTVAWDDENRVFTMPAGGQTVKNERYFGWEARVLPFLTVRKGEFNGHPTVGVSAAGPTTSLDYAEAKGILPEIVGRPLPYYRDVHIHGYTLYR